MNYIETKVTEMNTYIDNPTDENINKLKKIILIKDDYTYAKQILPGYSATLLLYLGVEGIKILKDLVKEAPGRMYPTSIIEIIYTTSMKQHANLRFQEMANKDIFRCPEITEEMAKYSMKAIHELVVESLNNSELFGHIIQFIWIKEKMSSMVGDYSFSKFVFNIFRESTIKINDKIIEEFEKIIFNSESREEDFQVYLKENPALIDPLAKEVIPKKKLGVEFITDFVLRKLNDEYVLVEIERPKTPIFTKSNDFTFQFTHALGQVIDFQEWVESNIAYAEKLMPGIVSPTGLLIIGLESDLNDFQKKKLRRFNINNQGKIKVITFDELIKISYKLYRNMMS